MPFQNTGDNTTLYIGIAIGVVLLIIIIFCLYLWKKKQTNKKLEKRTDLLFLRQQSGFENEVDRSAFKLLEFIGSGNFGSVHKGELNGLRGQNTKTIVAIKSINGLGSENEVSNFVSEIKIMSKVKPHLNLASMIASCTSEVETEGQLWLLLEFCEYGDLKNYLRLHKEEILSGGENASINNRCLLLWTHDIAYGMRYLAKNQIMHGDLAARNVLIGKDPLDCGYPLAKVADFGLSKKFYDNIRYEKQDRVQVPWKWMALEYLKDDYFTLTSDVWSFGVVVWEILSFGRSPYGPQGWKEVSEQLENGYRLPYPKVLKDIQTWSPEKLYSRISDACFQADPVKRASFSEVASMIEEDLTEEEKARYKQMIEKHQEMFLAK